MFGCRYNQPFRHYNIVAFTVWMNLNLVPILCFWDVFHLRFCANKR